MCEDNLRIFHSLNYLSHEYLLPSTEQDAKNTSRCSGDDPGQTKKDRRNKAFCSPQKSESELKAAYRIHHISYKYNVARGTDHFKNVLEKYT